VRRLIVLVGAVILVDTMFYAAITPLLPELSDRLGLGKDAAGLLAGAYAIGNLVGALPGGWLAARAGVRAAVLVGLAIMSAAGLAFAFGNSIVVLDGARFLHGVGGACSWAGGMAWLAAVAPPERRGEVIGTALGAAILGVQLGPVVGALATAIGREAAFSSTVLFAAALAIWAWTTPAPRGRAQPLTAPLAALRDRRVRIGMWLTVLPAMAFGVLDVLAPLRLDELGASGLAVGATFFAAAGVEAIISPLVGRLSDRRGAAAVVRPALVGAVAALLLLQLPESALTLALAVIVTGGVLGLLWAPAGGVISRGAERVGLEQGFAFALFNLAWASGFTVGSAAGGGLAEAAGDVVPYLIVAALFAAAAAWAFTTSRRAPPVPLRT
jgi:predicted MFS family arabinose efflux permease